MRKLGASLLLAMAVLVGSEPAFGAGSALLPANANFRGQNLEEWAVQAIEWQIATALGDPTGLSDTVQKVRFLPPTIGGGVFEYDVTLPTGTGFVNNSFFLFGERYDDGSQDNPADPFIPVIFEDAFIKTTLDGQVVLEGKAADFDDRLVGPVLFDEEIPYNEPQPRGPLNAVAATFFVGIGGVYGPLPVGEHTLESIIESTFFGNTEATFHITVVAAGKVQHVPEPSTIALVGFGLIGLVAVVRRRRAA
jgi:PEP-CTERM motif-containing protein